MDLNFYYTFNGFIVHNLYEVPINGILLKHPRLCGGKGGFGSMLRAIGSQIEKTTNREMCRDLNGRRMRDVNNEKRLKEWLDNADTREREKLESYLEKRRKRKLLLDQGPSAKMPFEDKSAEEQRKLIAEELQDAICEAFENRKNSENIPKVNVKPKKIKFEVDSDIDSTSSGSSSSSFPIHIKTECDNLENYVNCCSEPVELSSDCEVNNESEVLEIVDIPSETKLVENSEISKDETEVVSKSEKFVKEISFSPIDLDKVGSVNQLLTYGTDWIKNDLMRRGLKCGGTLMERARRLFSVKGLREYPAKLFVGATSKQK